MEYSKEVVALLKKNKVDVMHNVTVLLRDGRKFSGVIMQRGAGSDDILVVKLDNGYNIGLNVENITKIDDNGKVKDKNVGNKKDTKHETKVVRHKKSLVHIIGVGGTIASKVDYQTGAVYPLVSEDELLSAFPELSAIATIKSSQLFSLFSEDMTPDIWIDIAEEINRTIKNEKPNGIVVTHGTDTMHYTSAALSFMLQGLPCPIILTGAQRSSDRGSSDSKINLLSSVLAAKYKFGEVAVCMHASMNDGVCHVHRGTRVRKMHTSRRDAFKTVNGRPLLEVDWRKGKIIELSGVTKPKPYGNLKLDTKINSNVAMQYFYPGLRQKDISRLSEYDGVVLMGTGLGHVSTNQFNNKKSISLIKEIKELIDSNIPVVMTSQTIFGRINLNVYSSGRMLKEAGVIGHLCDFTPETAYVKLMWVLGHTNKMDKVKEMMETNIVGEISERSEVTKRLII